VGAQGEQPSGGESRRLTVFASVVAVALIVAYLVALGVAWAGTGSSDTVWARRLELLGGLEALAFAAAGAILGTSIQRQATKKADERADEYRGQAAANERDAEKGRALQAMARSKLRLEDEQGAGTRDVDAGTGTASALRDLVALGDELDAERRP